MGTSQETELVKLCRLKKMAGICSPNPTVSFGRNHRVRCCLGAVDDDSNKTITRTRGTPQALKLAVSGVTELLRLFSFSNKDRLDGVSYKEKDELPVSSVDDVILNLKSEYDNAYFVTGIFTSAIYAKDCIFEDPTISFQGTELYARNLKLLVPFFDCPSITLQKIEKGIDSNTRFVLATWKLRTYLKFPWRPLIVVDGRTVYELDDNFKIVRHAESWNLSALEAISQIFTPSPGRPGDRSEIS